MQATRTPRRVFARVGSLAVASGLSLLLVACTGAGGDPWSVARRAAGDPVAVAGLSVDAPHAQAVLLEDGLVNDAEYESAIRADRDCVAAAGYEPDEVQWHGGQLGFETTAT